MTDPSAQDIPGRGLIAWSWRGTAVFTITAVGATIFDELRPLAAIVALVLFAVGGVVFLVLFMAAGAVAAALLWGLWPAVAVLAGGFLIVLLDLPHLLHPDEELPVANHTGWLLLTCAVATLGFYLVPPLDSVSFIYFQF